MSKDMAIELKPYNVASVALYPGYVDTSRNRSPGTESPQFIGWAVAALAGDPNLMQKTEKTLIVAELAREYGFRDLDGTLPPVLSVFAVRRRFKA